MSQNVICLKYAPTNHVSVGGLSDCDFAVANEAAYVIAKYVHL